MTFQYHIKHFIFHSRRGRIIITKFKGVLHLQITLLGLCMDPATSPTTDVSSNFQLIGCYYPILLRIPESKPGKLKAVCSLVLAPPLSEPRNCSPRGSWFWLHPSMSLGNCNPCGPWFQLHPSLSLENCNPCGPWFCLCLSISLGNFNPCGPWFQLRPLSKPGKLQPVCSLVLAPPLSEPTVTPPIQEREVAQPRIIEKIPPPYTEAQVAPGRWRLQGLKPPYRHSGRSEIEVLPPMNHPDTAGFESDKRSKRGSRRVSEVQK